MPIKSDYDNWLDGTRLPTRYEVLSSQAYHDDVVRDVINNYPEPYFQVLKTWEIRKDENTRFLKILVYENDDKEMVIRFLKKFIFFFTYDLEEDEVISY